MLYTRRQIGKLALTGLPAAGLLLNGRESLAAADQNKPNSNWAGVQVGMNVPYNFGDVGMSGPDTLKRCVELGISAVELRAQPVEAFLGVPATLVANRGASSDALRKWRLSVSMEKVRAFRKMFEDAGVLIEILKWDGLYAMSADEVDYCFELGKALGAKALSAEIAVDETKRIGQFADKHKMLIGYHGHTAVTPAIWETAFSHANYNGANVDLGHFVAGNNASPVPFLKQHYERITHVHVKDRRLNNGPNVPFGEGDTPIREVLQLMRDSRWRFQATIEFEYRVPDGSDRMTEIAKSIEYCRKCLV